MVLKAAGFTDEASVVHIDPDGSAEAITQTISGCTQAMTGGMSDLAGVIKADDACALAVLTFKPVPGFRHLHCQVVGL